MFRSCWFCSYFCGFWPETVGHHPRSLLSKFFECFWVFFSALQWLGSDDILTWYAMEEGLFSSGIRPTVEKVNFTATSSRESYTPYNSNKHGKVVDYWKMSDGFWSELQCLRCFIRVHKAHRIHVWYIYLHFYHKNQPHVGKYTIHGSYGKNKIDATLVWNSHVPYMFREQFVKQPLRTHGWRPTSLANDWPWLFASWFRAGCPRNLRFIFLWFVVECWCAKPPWIDRKSLL